MSPTCRYEQHRISEEDALTASHFGGGDYRRPGRFYRSTICRSHAEMLLRHTTPGHTTVSNWSVSGLERVTGKTRDTLPWDSEGL